MLALTVLVLSRRLGLDSSLSRIQAKTWQPRFCEIAQIYFYFFLIFVNVKQACQSKPRYADLEVLRFVQKPSTMSKCNLRKLQKALGISSFCIFHFFWICLREGFLEILTPILSYMITQVILEKVLRSVRVFKRWCDAEILVIDEVSMLSLRTFEIIHFVAQGGRKSKQPFGGVQIVARGDFKQLPPVSSSIDPGRYCFESLIWEKCIPHLLYLDRVMRQTDIQYLNMLNEIAEGECWAAGRITELIKIYVGGSLP